MDIDLRIEVLFCRAPVLGTSPMAPMKQLDGFA
jgi:hypothetical protein